MSVSTVKFGKYDLKCVFFHYTFFQVTTFPKLDIPDVKPHIRKERMGKRILLVMMTLFWGMEIGFKFSSRTVIYLLNPCHIQTAIQVSELFSVCSIWKKSSLMWYVWWIMFYFHFHCKFTSPFMFITLACPRRRVERGLTKSGKQ